MAPAKPIATATQRRKPTTSPRTRAAPRVVKNGAVKLSAVASAIGIHEMAEKKNITVANAKTARKRCKPKRRVLNVA